VVDPATIYIVRDGDDLTTIATRFYGHPAAAAAIWQANRGLLSDPAVLPIGAALLLPPRGVVAGLGRAADQTVIEPLGVSQQGRPIGGGPVPSPASWLTGEGITAGGPRSP
jgi:phage tail protein X